MTTAQRETMLNRVCRIVDQRIGIVRWFHQNACMKHGLPYDDPSSVPTIYEKETTTTTVEPPAATSTAAASPASGGLSGLAKTAIATAVIGSGLGGAGLVSLLNQPSSSETTIEVNEQPQGGSLLQDLEDRGFHRPDGF